MLSKDQNRSTQLHDVIWTAVIKPTKTKRSKFRLELTGVDEKIFAEMFKEAEREKEEIVVNSLREASNTITERELKTTLEEALKISLKKATKKFRKALFNSFTEFLWRKYGKNILSSGKDLVSTYELCNLVLNPTNIDAYLQSKHADKNEAKAKKKANFLEQIKDLTKDTAGKHQIHKSFVEFITTTDSKDFINSKTRLTDPTKKIAYEWLFLLMKRVLLPLKNSMEEFNASFDELKIEK